jgi:hypothetical protein
VPLYGKAYRFTRENVDNAPETGGVYGLYYGEELIYVGSAAGHTATLRSRLQDHLSGRRGACTQHATCYKREITASGAARAKELLAEHLTYRRTLPRGNERELRRRRAVSRSAHPERG